MSDKRSEHFGLGTHRHRPDCGCANQPSSTPRSEPRKRPCRNRRESQRHGVAILMHQRQCVGDDNKTPTTHALADCPHRDLILAAAETILDEESARLSASTKPERP